MPDFPLELSRATDGGHDMAVIISLIERAVDWLQTQGTDQWASPWPSRAGRDSQIRNTIAAGTSWICRDKNVAAATITADPADPYWAPQDGAQAAVYVRRLVVSRTYAGFGLGAALLDWAGRAARRDTGARWVRVSAWTGNVRLHEYRRQGFYQCGLQPDDGYPSRAMFQKPVSSIPAAQPSLLRQA